MWITKLELNLHSRAARRDLANPYEMHRTLCRSVSHALKDGTERLLWRLEPVHRHERPVVLVQSLSTPDWSVLEEGYGEVSPPKEFRPALREGQVLRFRLRANPSRRLKETGKRVALKTRNEKLDWLARRLNEGGFRLRTENDRVLASILDDTYLEVSTGTHSIQVQAVLFEGVLEVRDRERAVRTIERGIGPGKALGLGLLSLSP